MRKRRLDAELVHRGLARSRAQAADLVASGGVLVAGMPASKAATGVEPGVSIVVRGEEEPHYASRGGHKLAGALAGLPEPGCDPRGRRCLDAGASTGGFTDVLLRAGAAEVVAVDVGYGQLAWALQSDSRVRVQDRTNIRHLQAKDIGGVAGLTVADLSFISLRLVLPALAGCTAADGDLLPMVKPQFEVGRGRLGQGGVVRQPALRAEAVTDVARAARDLGWGTRAVVTSPLPGPSGNVEFFLWLRRDAPDPDPEAIGAVVADGAAPGAGDPRADQPGTTP